MKSNKTTRRLIIAGAMLAATLVASPVVAAPLSEIGGKIQTPEGTPLDVPAKVLVYQGETCVSAAEVTKGGKYRLALSPGNYTLRIMLGDRELGSEEVEAKAGSWVHNPKAMLDELPNAIVAQK